MALPGWPYVFAPILSVFLIGIWLVSRTKHAHAMCEQVGFPQPIKQPLNSFFYLFANKEAITGIVLLCLQLAGEWKAVGIMLAVMCLGGMGDLYLAMTVGSFGFVQAFQAHGVMTLIAMWAAWRLMEENW